MFLLIQLIHENTNSFKETSHTRNMKNSQISSKSIEISYSTHLDTLTSLAKIGISTKIFTIKYNYTDFVVYSSQRNFQMSHKYIWIFNLCVYEERSLTTFTVS